MGDEADAGVGEFSEAGLFIGGQHGPVGGPGGSSNDEVVRPSLAAGALHIGQERGVVFSNVPVVLVDG